MSRSLKFGFASILNGLEKNLAPSLMELFKMKVGTHLAACTAVHYALLQTWKKILASRLSGPFILGFIFTSIF